MRANGARRADGDCACAYGHSQRQSHAIRNPSAYPNPNPNPYPNLHVRTYSYPYPHAHPNSHAYATPAPLPPSTECLTEIDPDLVVPKLSPYPIFIPPPPAGLRNGFADADGTPRGVTRKRGRRALRR